MKLRERGEGRKENEGDVQDVQYSSVQHVLVFLFYIELFLTAHLKADH